MQSEQPGYNREKFIRQLSAIDPRIGDLMSDWMVANDASISQAKKHLRMLTQQINSVANKVK